MIRPEEFERDLDQLLQWFEPVSLGDYLEHQAMEGGRRTMVLTFDDGLKECHQYIAPLLKKKGVPATFFLNNEFIDNRALFYRYKASLLIDRLKKDSSCMKRAANFLKIPGQQVEKSVLMINYNQRDQLDALAAELELDFSAYTQSNPVYMNTSDVKELLGWGFEIGGHSSDHVEFSGLEASEMILQVTSSLVDLEERYGPRSGYFSFPFTSDGVPETVIDTLLEEKIAAALLGSAGLKRTGKPAFIQRVPMEQYEAQALDVMKAEYLYYLFKRAAGKNRLRY
jgi:peptidoglycan/xylan/chitin deacetylase (PgdA/CDA1 family)